ncbi:DUF2637 domain-containing protein [Streptomyces carpaticus]|uniref:DUF2637 domain-containing protein n=1 Tax=Streptomyces carpaticus TaxID=285558 RepID=UPI0031F9FEDF
MSTESVPQIRITGWDRTAIIALGATGGALSFDALQQMAAAIHVRPQLVWLFPLVIDGFIAYSVRGLVVLRTAPFTARLYIWTLFATATATSIGANALHAVRLNQTGTGSDGFLQLGDRTVGLLSVAAPLALAGAVHLYILIARRATGTGPGPVPDRSADHAGAADHGPRSGAPSRPAALEHETAARPGEGRPSDRTGSSGPSATGGPPPADAKDPLVEQLLPIVLPAVPAGGRINRRAVREALKTRGIQISNERLGLVLAALRDEHDNDHPVPEGSRS